VVVVAAMVAMVVIVVVVVVVVQGYTPISTGFAIAIGLKLCGVIDQRVLYRMSPGLGVFALAVVELGSD
jgi:hypothetical protein